MRPTHLRQSARLRNIEKRQSWVHAIPNYLLSICESCLPGQWSASGGKGPLSLRRKAPLVDCGPYIQMFRGCVIAPRKPEPNGVSTGPPGFYDDEDDGEGNGYHVLNRLVSGGA